MVLGLCDKWRTGAEEKDVGPGVFMLTTISARIFARIQLSLWICRNFMIKPSSGWTRMRRPNSGFIEHGGDQLTGQKKVYYEKTKERDLAIVTLLLGTGIRVSDVWDLTLQMLILIITESK